MAKRRIRIASFFFKAVGYALLKLISYPLSTVRQRVAPQSQALCQSFPVINPPAFFVPVIFRYQLAALNGQHAQAIIQASQPLFLFCYFVGGVRSCGFNLDFIKRRATALRPFERLQAYQPCDLIAVAADVYDFYSFIKFSSNTVKGFVRLFFRERRSAPLKEPD